MANIILPQIINAKTSLTNIILAILKFLFVASLKSVHNHECSPRAKRPITCVVPLVAGPIPHIDKIKFVKKSKKQKCVHGQRHSFGKNFL